MNAFNGLIAASADRLVERVLHYAKLHGYTHYTAALIEDWRVSIARLSAGLLQMAASATTLPQIVPELDVEVEPVVSFGIEAARNQRSSGVSQALYFGLMKHYRQSYLDLLEESAIAGAVKKQGRYVIDRYFDLVEVGFIAEWERLARITDEKNRFLTIYESLPHPVLLLDRQQRVEHLNHAALRLQQATAHGRPHYRRDSQAGADLLDQLLPLAADTAVFEREIKVNDETQWFQVSTHRLPDASEKFDGMLVILTNITPLKLAEQQARELLGRQEQEGQARTAELLVMNAKLLQEVKERQRAEVEIQRLNADLERRVAKRTEELHKLDQQNTSKLMELTLLHQVSSLMLSTVRLNKLVHLILSALTSGADPCFERAMLFMINERSGVLQGMLGVTSEQTAGADRTDPLAADWDISEEEMARWDASEFTSLVRGCRLELNRSRNMSSRAVLDKKIVFVADTAKEKRVDRDMIDRFGITSFAVAPLMSKSRTYGIVVVDNPSSRRPISADSLRLLQLFTSQAGIAIENSMLYNSLEDTNRRLRDAQEQLIHGERLATIGEMAAGIAHELKGPLVAIGGFARRLARKIPHATQEAKYVDTIVSEVQRLEKMLTETLSFSKKATICYAKCTISEIIEEALGIVGPALAKGRIIVERRDPRKAFVLYGDCQQLEQVFINLFFNAQEAMKEQGAGTLRISVTTARLGGHKAIAVRVADTGGGIPLASLNNIFHSFYTTKATGTGLGLPIANRIVTNHGGKIQVANKGAGAEFTVILPRQE
jgi:signal transduction histidine kinase/PAS domain-containing protein